MSKKTLLFLFAAISSLCLSDPSIGFWPTSLFSFLLYLLGQHEIAQGQRNKYLFGFLYGLSFFTIIKLVVLRGFFQGFHSMTGNLTVSILSFVAFCLTEALLPALLAVLLQVGLTKRSRWYGLPLIFCALLATHQLWYLWIPQGIEYPLAQNSFLLASYGPLTTIGFVCWYLLFTIATYLFYRPLWPWQKTRHYVSALMFLLLVPFVTGMLRIQTYQRTPATMHPVILVQTNQSESPAHPVALDWEELGLRFKQMNLANRPLIVFPEYTANSANPLMQKFITELQTRDEFDLIIGVEDTRDGQLINEAWHFTKQGKAQASGKLIGFPIGEASLSLPFIPKAWLRAQVPIATTGTIQDFTIPQTTIRPLICYDATFSKNFADTASVVVNISKDSHLQNTSALDWLDLVIRTKISQANMSAIRVSTNSFTEVVAPWGETLSVSKKNNFEIIEAQLPLY